MKLLIEYKPELLSFVKEELKDYSKSFKKLNEGLALVSAELDELVVKSSMIESVSVFIGLVKDFSSLKNYDFPSLFNSTDSFRIKCSDRKVCINLGQMVKDSTNARVDLENPDKIIFVEKLESEWLVRLLIIDKLHIRGYSVTNSSFINGDVARALIEYSEWDDNGLLLDPFCNEGFIPIEAALKGLQVGPGFFKAKELSFDIETPRVKKLKSKIVCFTNKMKDLKFAKQNAKLGRVTKYLRFGFHELNDLDYKLKESTVDYVISALPDNLNFKELFFQLEYVMKKGGVAVFFIKAFDTEVFKEYGFKLVWKKDFLNKILLKLVKE